MPACNYINKDDWILPRYSTRKAQEAARKALAIAETDTLAHLALATTHQWHDWDWAASEREFKLASELDLGSLHVFMRRWDEAITQLHAAIDLNYWFDSNYVGRQYVQSGSTQKAIHTFQRGLKLKGNTELW